MKEQLAQKAAREFFGKRNSESEKEFSEEKKPEPSEAIGDGLNEISNPNEKENNSEILPEQVEPEETEETKQGKTAGNSN